MFTKDCGQQGADEQETDSRCDTERQIAWKNVWENWTSEHWHRSQEWYTICHRAIGSIMFCVWRKALVILKTFYTTVTFYGSCFWCTVYPCTGDLHKTILCEPIYHELFITQPLLLMGSLVFFGFFVKTSMLFCSDERRENFPKCTKLLLSTTKHSFADGYIDSLSRGQ